MGQTDSGLGSQGKSLFAREILSRSQVKTNVVELLIWTRFPDRLFKIEPETRATKADETHHVQMRRTLSAVLVPTERPCVCAWHSGGFRFTHAHLGLLKLDPLTPKRLGATAAGNFRHPFFLLHACAPICHFTPEIRRLRARMRRAPASL